MWDLEIQTWAVMNQRSLEGPDVGVRSSLLTLSSLVFPGPGAALNSLQEAARTTGQTLPPGATLDHLPLNHAVGTTSTLKLFHNCLSVFIRLLKIRYPKLEKICKRVGLGKKEEVRLRSVVLTQEKTSMSCSACFSCNNVLKVFMF